VNGEILLRGTPDEVRRYVAPKMRLWASWKYSKKERIKKSLSYYDFASVPNREIIKSTYIFVCKEPWPSEEQTRFEKALAAKALSTHKLPRQDAIELKEERIGNLELAVKQLETWQRNQDYQYGEDFFLELRSYVEPVLSGTFNLLSFQHENKLRTVSELTSSGSKGNGKLEGEFGFLVGMQAKSSSDFKFDNGLIQGAAQLEAEMRVGAWGSGSVAARISKGGISAEAAIALAMGMECRVDASSTWQAGDFGLLLEGGARVFVGAEANANVALKISKKGFEASVKAGAFAGVKAECRGAFAFKYLGEDMVSGDASAYVSFGAGGEFEASIKSSLFGATELKFKAGCAVGLGTGADTSVAINFTRIGLAGASQFRRLIYLPTIMKGYSPSLSDYDKLNTHYLNKALGRLREELESQTTALRVLNRVPEEKQSLLLGMDN
jgi:hypothetical protein